MMFGARAALISGRTIVGHWHGSGCPLLAEAVTSTADYDVLVLDLQHGIIDAPMAMAVMASCRNASPWIRMRDIAPSHIHHCLDAGAGAVIAPLINSAADAAALVREARYPPLGTRSFGPIRAGLLAPDYFKIANAHVLCWAMIETAAALEQVEAIAAVDGLDGLFIGPNDLSLALGVEPSSAPTDPKVVAAILKIRDAAHASFKKVGIFCLEGATAAHWASQGFDFVIAGTDTGLVAAAAARELEAARRGSRPAAAPTAGDGGVSGMRAGGGY